MRPTVRLAPAHGPPATVIMMYVGRVVLRLRIFDATVAEASHD